MVTGRDGEQLALVGETAARTTAGARPAAADGSATPAFWPHPAGVLEVVSVPITLGLDRPELLGTLSIGYLLDDRRAAQFKALTGADIAFAMGGVVRASTLGPGSAEALTPLLAGHGVKRDLDRRRRIRRDLAAARPQQRPDAIRPRSSCARAASACARSSAIQAALAGIALGATLLAIVVSYGVARTITRPLASITDHMRHIAATGDLTRKIADQTPGRLG